MRTIRLLLVLFVCAVPVAADTVYQVTGSATITGNPVCGGSPCIETVNFSFLVDYLLVYPGAYDPYVENLVSVISIGSTGPLAPFNRMGAIADYFGFFNSAGDEIDVNGPYADGSNAPAPFPDLRDSELYGCSVPADPICVHDFVPPGGPSFGHVRFGTLRYSFSAVPEGSTRLHLLVGVGLGLLGMLAVTRVR